MHYPYIRFFSGPAALAAVFIAFFLAAAPAQAIPAGATLDQPTGSAWLLSGSISFDTDDLGDGLITSSVSSTITIDIGGGNVVLSTLNGANSADLETISVSYDAPGSIVVSVSWMFSSPIGPQGTALGALAFFTPDSDPDLPFVPGTADACQDTPVTGQILHRCNARDLSTSVRVETTSAPEPASLTLFGLGLLAIAGYRHRRS